MKLTTLIVLLLTLPMIGCGNRHENNTQRTMQKETIIPEHADTISFGAGCFWCTEAVFSQLKGVLKVTPGYMGGASSNPAYREVCTGTTGHAEVAQVVYDPAVITFAELLEVFWTTHDPTTLNRQGADAGTQYRSAIFWNTDEQRQMAEDFRKKLTDENAFGKPVVTQIAKAGTFYRAEDYHIDYYANNPEAPYCLIVIAPKVEKVRKVFREKLK